MTFAKNAAVAIERDLEEEDTGESAVDRLTKLLVAGALTTGALYLGYKTYKSFQPGGLASATLDEINKRVGNMFKDSQNAGVEGVVRRDVTGVTGVGLTAGGLAGAASAKAAYNADMEKRRPGYKNFKTTDPRAQLEAGDKKGGNGVKAVNTLRAGVVSGSAAGGLPDQGAPVAPTPPTKRSGKGKQKQYRRDLRNYEAAISEHQAGKGRQGVAAKVQDLIRAYNLPSLTDEQQRELITTLTEGGDTRRTAAKIDMLMSSAKPADPGVARPSLRERLQARQAVREHTQRKPNPAAQAFVEGLDPVMRADAQNFVRGVQPRARDKFISGSKAGLRGLLVGAGTGAGTGVLSELGAWATRPEAGADVNGLSNIWWKTK